MITAIFVFFVAIFVGMLFLLALMRFFFRRKNNAPTNFAETSANYDSEYVPSQTSLFDSDDAAIYTADSVLENQNHEHHAAHQTAHDSSHQTDNSYSHESHGASAAPADTSFTESGSSSYDSGSSSDSSSSDSGSSDSGGSSSSSD